MMVLQSIGYILLGYLWGSILHARIAERFFHKEGMISGSKDNNPGAGNAFMRGGFFCGVFTLVGDLFKGILPVALIVRTAPETLPPVVFAFAVAAPVVGHCFPIFYGFQGGKGIATTFGVLLGLLPWAEPLLCFALSFVLLSTVLRVTPHFSRTLVAYGLAIAFMLHLKQPEALVLAFLLITLMVTLRMLMSKEPREKTAVHLLWFGHKEEEEERQRMA